jgi:hypothetical protein
MDYTELGGAEARPRGRDGEVQIFRDYRRRVSVARVARREVLCRQPLPDDLNPLIWDHVDTVRARNVD